AAPPSPAAHRWRSPGDSSGPTRGRPVRPSRARPRRATRARDAPWRCSDPSRRARTVRATTRTGRGAAGRARARDAGRRAARRSPGARAAARRGRTVIYASGAELQTINPLLAVHPLAKQVQRYVLLTTLARYDSALNPQPYLARAWWWSADKKTLTFRLAPGVRWHDGVAT